MKREVVITQKPKLHMIEKKETNGNTRNKKIHVVWRFENCLSLALSNAKKQKTPRGRDIQGTPNHAWDKWYISKET